MIMTIQPNVALKNCHTVKLIKWSWEEKNKIKKKHLEDLTHITFFEQLGHSLLRLL